MPKGPFRPEQFVPTEWSTTEEKAKFGNTFLRFVKSDFERRLFTKVFYERLMHCYSHIAHFNIHGFYNTWFERDVDRLSFLRHTLKHPCHGSPEFTFCDVERVIQIELRKLNLIPIYEQRIDSAIRRHELSELARLQKKYGVLSLSTAEETPEQKGSTVEIEALKDLPPCLGVPPVQGSLFPDSEPRP